jgi:hypothetical protein
VRNRRPQTIPCRRVTALVGCEKHHGPGDLIWCEPGKRNTWKIIFNVSGPFLRKPADRSLGGSMQPGGSAGFSSLSKSVRTNRWRLCGVVQNSAREDERLQDDRDAIRHSWQRLLHRKKQALKSAVLHSFCGSWSSRLLGQTGAHLRNSGLPEPNIEPDLLSLVRTGDQERQDLIQLLQVGYILTVSATADSNS